LFTKSLEAINNHSVDGKHTIGSSKLPLVSIIVTNYNYGEFLEECLDSCINQDYEFCEVIVVDDASTDDSLKKLERYSDSITILSNDSNKGQLASFFTGLKVANGEFIVFVDSDDFLDHDAISAHLYIHLFQKPPVGFTCLRNRQVSKNSYLLNDFHMDFYNNNQEIAYISPRVIHTPTWSWSTTSAMMFRADLLRLIATENTDDFRVCADYYIVHFANLLGGSLLFDRAKVNYRRHGGNSFSKNFLIGGQRPTGHEKYHNHPGHATLQKAILSKLIFERERFEPYFSNLEIYAETILFVAPLNLVLSNYQLDNSLKNALVAKEKRVKNILKEQLGIKKWAIKWFQFHDKFLKIKSVKESIQKCYGVRLK